MAVKPGSIRDRYHLIQEFGKPGRSGQWLFEDATGNSADDATIRQIAALTLVRERE
jgi:hypothetical protein